VKDFLSCSTHYSLRIFVKSSCSYFLSDQRPMLISGAHTLWLGGDEAPQDGSVRGGCP
jgi:hypothetical protein